MNPPGSRSHAAAVAHAEAIADRLASPAAVLHPCGSGLKRPQSLAQGAAGVALLHIERARAGLAGWDTVHAWLTAATREDISAGPDAGLFFGVPAVVFAVQAAAVAVGSSRYDHPLKTLDDAVDTLTRRRLDQAHARIDRSERPTLAEWDLVRGLTGLGAYLLRRDPSRQTLRQVLSYLVRLTEPLDVDGKLCPAGGPTAAP